jgi:hypothetical protein
MIVRGDIVAMAAVLFGVASCSYSCEACGRSFLPKGIFGHLLKGGLILVNDKAKQITDVRWKVEHLVAKDLRASCYDFIKRPLWQSPIQIFVHHL